MTDVEKCKQEIERAMRFYGCNWVMAVDRKVLIEDKENGNEELIADFSEDIED